MSKKQRAVLRGMDGEFLKHLDPDQLEVYEVYAEQRRVHRSAARSKGHQIITFRLKEKCLPEVEASESRHSHCSLTRGDMELLVTRRDQGARIPRVLRERWIGWGLIPAPAL